MSSEGQDVGRGSWTGYKKKDEQITIGNSRDPLSSTAKS